LRLRARRDGRDRPTEEDAVTDRADFRKFYKDAHAVACLSEREKIFLGLAVAFTRNCQP
jgi:hypothetical protein